MEAGAESVMLTVSIASSRLGHILPMCATDHARWRFVILRREVTVAREIDPTWPRLSVCDVAVVSPVIMMVL